jgi:hypothetical protein
VATVVILLILVGAGGWYAHQLRESPPKLSDVKALLDNGVKDIQASLTKKNLEEAEQKLAALRKVAAKDGRIAALESQLLEAKLAKAMSDGQLDKAKDLLAKAEKDGNVAIDDIKKWRDKIEAAQKPGSGSASTSAADEGAPVQ